ncbi:hypothetical protein HK097_005254 [Rhizophlyctis rosea]|uniref:Major facilitator superfamily (MFS) profile domain-containing protein n=1 Tax=Rhizophlyctis rosea TaxID=64517 RepID=A0AAD5SDF5_9FUNG|nr:hypothetical protein HK097_005254 [Rhizophlyctis rosea]
MSLSNPHLSENTPLLPKDNDDEPRTPASRTQFLALYTAVLIEPIAGSLIQPFIYFMIQSFGLPPSPDDPSQIGWYVFLIHSVYSLSQVVSSIPIGLLSDRFGRRKMLLIGLAGNIVSPILFGLARNFEEAVGARVLLGLINGNTGVAKSITGEITTPLTRANAFGMFNFWASIGDILGSLIGGYLSNPAEKYPDVFGSSAFFAAYPYFLPGLVAAILGAIGFAANWVLLEETLPDRGGNVRVVEVEGKREVEKSGKGTRGARRGKGKFLLPDQAWPPVMALGLLGLVNAMNYDAFPLLANTPAGGDNGGLGFGTRRLGLMLSSRAGFKLIAQVSLCTMEVNWSRWVLNLSASQLLVYPPITARLGPLSTLRLGIFLLLLTTILTPVLPSIPYDFLFPPLLALLFLQSTGVSLSLTSTYVLVTDSAPSQAWLGVINGVAQMGACTARTVGPALLGWVWKWGRENGAFPWLVWGVIAGVCLLLGWETLWIGRRRRRV